MKTKGQNVIGFITALLLIVCVLLLAILGLGSFKGVFADGSITLGLDLVGGSRIVYEAQVEGRPADLEDNMQAVISMMRSRLDMLGYTEATVSLDGEKRVIVEIPSVKDPEDAVQLLGSMAELTFVNSKGEVVLGKGDIIKAEARYDVIDVSGLYQNYIALTLADSAVAKFADATEAAAKLSASKENWIAILLDGEEQSKPYVEKRLETKEVTITGAYDKETAEYLAGIINAGQLPFAVRDIQLDTVEATLGEKALSTSLIAGAIGIVLVMIFMIVFYRLPGLMASIALTGYTGLLGLALVAFNVNLSLAGIAGIILSIGMAVDANVVIFERMKEELKLGKSTNAALKSGFKRAFTAILDSNVTTLIAAIVLWIFGTGSIQGFAITLFLGVILSMFTSLVVTRYLLSRLVGMRVTKPTLWGVHAKRSSNENDENKRGFDFSAKRKVLFLISGAVIIVGTLFMIIRGFNPDIDFTGGTTMHIDMSSYLESQNQTSIDDSLRDQVIQVVEKAANVSVSSFQRANGGTECILKIRGIEALETEEISGSEWRQIIFKAVADKYGLADDDLLSTSHVGATISGELKKSAVMAVSIAIALMLVYITIRFDFRSGLAAIVCLCHDVFIMMSAYAIVGVPLNSTMIAALLTILGYSINATIIVFDRVRENKKRKNEEFNETVNNSIHQTLTRSLNTTITTFLTIAALYIMGVSSIRQFALPLMVGIIAGLYSSVCLAGNLWYVFSKWIHLKKKKV